MPGTPDYGLGAHIDVVTIVGQTRAANGTFSAGTSYNLLDVILAVRPTNLQELEDIRPAWSTQINMVPIGGGWGGSVTVLRRSNTGDDIVALKATYQYCLATWTFGKEQWVAYFVIGTLEAPMEGHGQQTITLNFEPCDPGTAQLVRTVLA